MQQPGSLKQRNSHLKKNVNINKKLRILSGKKLFFKRKYFLHPFERTNHLTLPKNQFFLREKKILILTKKFTKLISDVY